MLNRLVQLREEREEGDRGFTLIELLVVVVIIGILIAIAIPLYLNYKKGANDKASGSDLRAAVSTLELCVADTNTYPTGIGSASDATPWNLTGCASRSLKASDGTSFAYAVDNAAAPANYDVYAYNSKGAGKVWCYASASGGSVKVSGLSALPTSPAYASGCPVSDPTPPGGASTTSTSTAASSSAASTAASTTATSTAAAPTAASTSAAPTAASTSAAPSAASTTAGRAAASTTAGATAGTQRATVSNAQIAVQSSASVAP